MKRVGQFFVSLAGVLLPLLPKGACPLCLGAYGALLSTLGLGFLATEKALVPLVAAALALALGSLALSARGHRQPGPLLVALAGAAAVVAGRLLGRVPPLLYLGLGLLFGASLWNLWLGRPRREPLIQLRPARTKGEPS